MLDLKGIFTQKGNNKTDILSINYSTNGSLTNHFYSLSLVVDRNNANKVSVKINNNGLKTNKRVNSDICNELEKYIQDNHILSFASIQEKEISTLDENGWNFSIWYKGLRTYTITNRNDLSFQQFQLVDTLVKMIENS